MSQPALNKGRSGSQETRMKSQQTMKDMVRAINLPITGCHCWKEVMQQFKMA